MDTNSKLTCICLIFSRFAYEINYFDSEHANVLVLFEDFEELDEEKMCSKMKKSIAEYMNQVDKELFLECMKNLKSKKSEKIFVMKTPPSQHYSVFQPLIQ